MPLRSMSQALTETQAGAASAAAAARSNVRGETLLKLSAAIEELEKKGAGQGGSSQASGSLPQQAEGFYSQARISPRDAAARQPPSPLCPPLARLRLPRRIGRASQVVACLAVRAFPGSRRRLPAKPVSVDAVLARDGEQGQASGAPAKKKTIWRSVKKGISHTLFGTKEERASKAAAAEAAAAESKMTGALTAFAGPAARRAKAG